MGVDYPQTINLIVDILTDVGKGLIGAWLYDKLKNSNVRSLKVDGEEVEVDEESIESALEK